MGRTKMDENFNPLRSLRSLFSGVPQDSGAPRWMKIRGTLGTETWNLKPETWNLKPIFVGDPLCKKIMVC